ncbi:MAG: GldG family protein [Spirochaetales bacterium]|nr:GldG family protein [Spirochaetales bacterium]
MESKKTPTKEKSLFRFIKFGLYALIAILVYVLAVNWFGLARLDLTSNSANSLSPVSREAVKALKGPLTINVFLTENLPAPYNDLDQYMQDMLNEYSLYGGRNFNFTFYPVSATEGQLTEKAKKNQELASDYRIQAEQIQTFEDDQVSLKQAYLGMALIYGDVVEKISPITQKAQLEYQITTTIRKMNAKISKLLSLEEPIQAKFFLSSDLIAKAKLKSSFVDDLENKIKEVSTQNYDALKYEYIDISKQPEKSEDAKKYNATSVNIDGTSYYCSLALVKGDKFEKVATLSPLYNLFGQITGVEFVDLDNFETTINDSLTSLLDVNEKIGYLSDIGTLNLTLGAMLNQNPAMEAQLPADMLQDRSDYLNYLLTEEYSMENVNLADSTIPKGINTLVLAGPKEQFNDWQLYQIDQFLMQGKSLAIFLDGLKMTMPDQNAQMYGQQLPPSFDKLKTGLEKLIEHYGAKVEHSYVFDTKALESVDRTYGKVTFNYVPVIQENKVNQSLPFLKNLSQFTTLQASPITLLDDKIKEQGLIAKVLFSSSEESWTESDNIQLNPLQTILPQEDEMKSYALAVSLEGKFSSYFKGKDIPVKPQNTEATEEESEQSNPLFKDAAFDDKMIEESISPGRIILVGSSKMLTDMNIVNTNTSSNQGPRQQTWNMVRNLIDYVAGQENIAAMRTKQQVDRPLKEIAPAYKEFIRYFNIIGLILLVAVIGALVIMRIKARKLLIQKEFSEKE